MEGTFPITQVHLNTGKPSPDVIVALRWTDQRNEFGAPGMLLGDGGKKGDGTHGSLSGFDMHNMLVASGPDFRQGFVDERPTGNADLAPTILYLLGLQSTNSMDGRVLLEALDKAPAVAQKPESTTIRASCDVGLRHWEQYLKFTKMGDQVYFDEGNGESALK